MHSYQFQIITVFRCPLCAHNFFEVRLFVKFSEIRTRLLFFFCLKEKYINFESSILVWETLKMYVCMYVVKTEMKSRNEDM